MVGLRARPWGRGPVGTRSGRRAGPCDHRYRFRGVGVCARGAACGDCPPAGCPSGGTDCPDGTGVGTPSRGAGDPGHHHSASWTDPHLTATRIRGVAQFIAVCSAYKLAEELRLSSMLRRRSCEKRGASATLTHVHVHQLRPTTNSDKLSEALYGLDHGIGHLRPLSITWQHHLLAYHDIAMSHAGLGQV